MVEGNFTEAGFVKCVTFTKWCVLSHGLFVPYSFVEDLCERVYQTGEF